ncbi:MAG: hypothetical protein HY608_02020 [Planctomycetes bacterium]|nr:hypothetical protein [Planctomycetota bacterium]
MTLSGLRSRLAHAFAVEPEGGTLPAEEEALLDRLADAVARRGMASPAGLFLDASAPLGFLGAQALHFLRPFTTALFSAEEVDRLAAILERRGGVSRLARKIEEASRPPARTA